MRDVIGKDLSGGLIKEVNLRGAWIQDANLTEARVHDAWMHLTKLTGVWLEDVEVSGKIVGSLVINGVDVAPLIAAELDRRHPERALLRPTDAAGLRESWAVIEATWASVIERARALPEPLLHERVDQEWSFLETLRHLVFATDAWISRMVLDEPHPFHPWGVSHMDLTALGLTFDDVDPSLDEVLPIRAERLATVRRVVHGLTDADLDRVAGPKPPPGYPAGEARTVLQCIAGIVNEEWEHHLYATRDLAILEAG